MKIAIDGPAGAGKSTISKAVAEKLGYVYIDTGAMYRCVGLHALNSGVDPSDAAGVEKILDGVEIDIKSRGGVPAFYLCGDDVTDKIRENPVSMAASNVAVIPAVRLKLVELQRDLAGRADVVMDGRDIGTYVLPNAELKIFMTADSRERARRRLKDLAARGESADLDRIEKEIIARDKNDSEREFAPLRQADDAVLLDTTDMTITDVIGTILGMAEKKIAEVEKNGSL